jgi:hypothetical protein
MVFDYLNVGYYLNVGQRDLKEKMKMKTLSNLEFRQRVVATSLVKNIRCASESPYANIRYVHEDTMLKDLPVDVMETIIAALAQYVAAEVSA